jgi:hypothetical protein
VLVAHGSPVGALSGIAPGMGEIVVVKPEGGGKFVLVGKARGP